MRFEKRLLATFLCLAAFSFVNAQVAWTAEATLASRAGASSIAVADMNGDGHLDIFFGGEDTNGLQLVIANGDGTFQAPVVVAGDQGVRKIDVADMDGDGNLDVLFTARAAVRFRRGDGAGGFSGTTTLDSASNLRASGVRGVDLDGDGDLDAVALSTRQGFVAAYENLGGGVFGSRITLHTMATSVNSSIGALEVASVDGGVPQVFFGELIEDTISWIPNTSDPVNGLSFGTAMTLETGVASPTHLLAIDLDLDGDRDLIGASNSGTGSLRWFENQAGVLGAAQPINYASAVVRFDLADINGDGNEDLVVNGANAVRWIEHFGGGLFGAAQDIPLTVSNSRGVVARDLDGDGYPEVLATGASSNTLNLVGNRGPYPGSGFDFVLRTTLNGQGADQRIMTADANDLLVVQWESAATYVGAPSFLLANSFATGTPPATSPLFPTLHIDLATSSILSGPTALPLGGLSIGFTVPAGISGFSFLFQAGCLQGNAFNPAFTVTDAHEIRLDT